MSPGPVAFKDREEEISKFEPQIKLGIKTELEHASIQAFNASRNTYNQLASLLKTKEGGNDFLKGSLIGKLTPKDFKNSEVHYAYNKETDIYSVSVLFNNRPMILTVRAGKDTMDISLVDKRNGELVEYIGQSSNKITFQRNDLIAKQFR